MSSPRFCWNSAIPSAGMNTLKYVNMNMQDRQIQHFLENISTKIINKGYQRCCGSGSGIRCFLTPISGNGMGKKNQDPGRTTRIIFSERLETVFRAKHTRFFDADPESFWPWIRDVKILQHRRPVRYLKSGVAASECFWHLEEPAPRILLQIHVVLLVVLVHHLRLQLALN